MKTFKEELINTWKIFQENWVSFFIIFVINIILMVLCCIPIGLSIVRTGLSANINKEQLLSLMKDVQFLIPLFISANLAFLAYIFSLIASFTIASGEKKWKQAIKKAFSLFWRVYFMVLFGLFLACIGFCLLIIPGVLILFYLSFILPVMINENTGIIETMKRSRFLIKNNWKAIAWRFFLFALVTCLFNAIIEALHLGTLDTLVSLIFLPIFYTVLYKEVNTIQS